MNSLSLLEEITQVIQKWELIYLRLNLSFTTNPIHIQGFHKTTERALEKWLENPSTYSSALSWISKHDGVRHVLKQRCKTGGKSPIDNHVGHHYNHYNHYRLRQPSTARRGIHNYITEAQKGLSSAYKGFQFDIELFAFVHSFIVPVETT